MSMIAVRLRAQVSGWRDVSFLTLGLVRLGLVLGLRPLGLRAGERLVRGPLGESGHENKWGLKGLSTMIGLYLVAGIPGASLP